MPSSSRISTALITGPGGEKRYTNRHNYFLEILSVCFSSSKMFHVPNYKVVSNSRIIQIFRCTNAPSGQSWTERTSRSSGHHKFREHRIRRKRLAREQQQHSDNTSAAPQ
jgi:hypothetical protein